MEDLEFYMQMLREELSLLINDDLDNLDHPQIVKLSKELDKLVFKCMNDDEKTA